jgi:hypothetical protein
MVVHTHLSIAISLPSGASVTVHSAPAAPTRTDEEPPMAQIVQGMGAHDTARIEALVSDGDEFTSVPSATAAMPATPDLGPTVLGANGTGNGHNTLVG